MTRRRFVAQSKTPAWTSNTVKWSAEVGEARRENVKQDASERENGCLQGRAVEVLTSRNIAEEVTQLGVGQVLALDEAGHVLQNDTGRSHPALSTQGLKRSGLVSGRLVSGAMSVAGRQGLMGTSRRWRWTSASIGSAWPSSMCCNPVLALTEKRRWRRGEERWWRGGERR